MTDAALNPGLGMAAKDGKSTLRHSHIGRKGDLAVELHYGDFDTGHKRQAALYIFRANTARPGIYIPLSMMWMFAEKDALHVMIPPLVEQLYGFVTRDDHIRVLDAILDYLEDLRKSPPDPDLYKDRSLDAFLQSFADEGLDFKVKINGDTVINTQ